MNILVPIKVNSEPDRYIVTLPFDSSFKVEATTLNDALSQVTNTLAPSIQVDKDLSIIEKLRQNEPQNAQFLKIDFFSKGEHILMGFILFAVLLIPYMFIGAALTWTWAITYSPFANDIFTAKLVPLFSSNMAALGVLRIILFLAIWSIIYNYIYPRFLNFYSDLLIKNKIAKGLHKKLITQFSFTKKNDYNLNEKLS